MGKQALLLRPITTIALLVMTKASMKMFTSVVTVIIGTLFVHITSAKAITRMLTGVGVTIAAITFAAGLKGTLATEFLALIF